MSKKTTENIIAMLLIGLSLLVGWVAATIRHREAISMRAEVIELCPPDRRHIDVTVVEINGKHGYKFTCVYIK